MSHGLDHPQLTKQTGFNHVDENTSTSSVDQLILPKTSLPSQNSTSEASSSPLTSETILAQPNAPLDSTSRNQSDLGQSAFHLLRSSQSSSSGPGSDPSQAELDVSKSNTQGVSVVHGLLASPQPSMEASNSADHNDVSNLASLMQGALIDSSSTLAESSLHVQHAKTSAMAPTLSQLQNGGMFPSNQLPVDNSSVSKTSSYSNESPSTIFIPVDNQALVEQQQQQQQIASPVEQKMVAEAAQRVLEAARRQARLESSKNGKSRPASPKKLGDSLSPVASISSEPKSAAHGSVSPGQDPKLLSPTSPSVAAVSSKDENLSRTSSSSKAASDSSSSASNLPSEKIAKSQSRKSFFGTLLDKTSKKSRNRTNSASSPIDSKLSNNGSSDSIVPIPSRPSQSGQRATSDDKTGTTGRRRRFVDTRDIDLLAMELAAEAIASGLPNPPFARSSRSGSSSPMLSHRSTDPNRRSFHSTRSGNASPINASQTNLSNVLMAPFNSTIRSREVSFSNPSGLPWNAIPSSSLPASPPMPPNDLARLDPAINMIPQDMLAGITNSPYSVIQSRRQMDRIQNFDPFGIPLSYESPFDATMAYNNRSSAPHSPNQVNASQSSPSLSSPNLRKPVLQMSFHDPESELQGLTKPSQSKKATPFGSRASSRAATPRPSFTNLKEKSDSQAEKAFKTVSNDSPSPRANSSNVRQASPAFTWNDSFSGKIALSQSKLNVQASSSIEPSFVKAKSMDLGPNASPSSNFATESARSSRPMADGQPNLSIPTSRTAKRLSSLFSRGKNKEEKNGGADLEKASISPPPNSLSVNDGGKLGIISPETRPIPRDLQETTQPLSDDKADTPKAHSSATDLTSSTLQQNNDRLAILAGSTSPESCAVSATSDPSLSPMSLRRELPSVNGQGANIQREQTKSTLLSTVGSRSTKVEDIGSAKTEKESSSTSAKSVSPGAKREQESDSPSNPSKNGFKRFLRRLSSFGSSNANMSKSSKAIADEVTKKKSAKANFPSISTMPKLDSRYLKKNFSSTSLAQNEKQNVADPVNAKRAQQSAEPEKANGVVRIHNSTTIHPDMAKNGFGTKSATIVSIPLGLEDRPSLPDNHTGSSEGSAHVSSMESRHETISNESSNGSPSTDFTNTTSSKSLNPTADRPPALSAMAQVHANSVVQAAT